jgi:hypothetical protein
MGPQENAGKLLAILGGDLVRDGATGKWRTTMFEDTGDKFGILGDQLRVVAGWHLYQEDPYFHFVVVGGESNQASDAPTTAMVMKHELMELGVPEQAIVTERRSFTTYQQLSSIQEIVEEEMSASVLIVSNRYHLGRIQAFTDHAPALLRLRQLHTLGQLTLQEAEAILIARDPKTWKARIDAAYQSTAMNERITGEERGVRQIREGTFSFE